MTRPDHDPLSPSPADESSGADAVGNPGQLYMITATIRDHRGNHRMIFAYLAPDGSLQAVVDAETYQDAWVIATGWEDKPSIAQRARAGWQIIPASVVWGKHNDKRFGAK